MESLLQQFKQDDLSIDEVLVRLKNLPYEDLDYAKVDHHRAIRTGVPEVVFAEGKSIEQVRTIASSIWEVSGRLLITRASPEMFSAVGKVVPGSSYNEIGRTIVANDRNYSERRPGLVVASAGTSDLSVALEAIVTAEFMGCEVERLFDVGVAGIHRLLSKQSVLRDAKVIIAVAGMEGALASVVGGLVGVPVIAVPTSVGYGANFGGLSALLTMLNSCAPGVSVVNIDNGFGAGYLAAMINNSTL